MSPNGTCDCFDGYVYDNCSKAICSGGCSGHGECIDAQMCNCDEGYLGSNCETERFSKLQSAASSVLWAGIIVCASVASMFVGVAISTAYYISKGRFPTSIKEDLEPSEIQLEVLDNSPVITPQKATRPPFNDWKRVSNSKEWFI